MSAFKEKQRERLARYLKNRDELGEAAAREVLVNEYLVGQQHVLGPHTDGVPLAVGFARMRPMTERLGVREEFVDVSSEGVDAALAIQVTCSCREAGCTDTPVICDAYREATARTFPHLSVQAVLQQINGAHVCVFNYSRPDAARPDAARPEAARPEAARPGAAGTEAAGTEAVRPGAARPEAVRTEAVRGGGPRGDVGRGDVGRGSARCGDAVGGDGGGSDTGRSVASGGDGRGDGGAGAGS